MLRLMMLAWAGIGTWDEFRFVLLVVLAFVALYALTVFLWDRWKRYRTRGWSTAVATVSDVTYEEFPGAKGGHYTRLEVFYTYTGASEQTGSYTFTKDSYGAARKLAESLPGTEFNIRYNPAREADSVVLLADRPD